MRKWETCEKDQGWGFEVIRELVDTWILTFFRVNPSRLELSHQKAIKKHASRNSQWLNFTEWLTSLRHGRTSQQRREESCGREVRGSIIIIHEFSVEFCWVRNDEKEKINKTAKWICHLRSTRKAFHSWRRREMEHSETKDNIFLGMWVEDFLLQAEWKEKFVFVKTRLQGHQNRKILEFEPLCKCFAFERDRKLNFL